jgi:hypothetical protein
MSYVAHPVYHDPPSNQWFGFQAWSMDRFAQYLYVTKDKLAAKVLHRWIGWVLSITSVSSNGILKIPATLSWSGAPATVSLSTFKEKST